MGEEDGSVPAGQHGAGRRLSNPRMEEASRPAGLDTGPLKAPL